MAKRRKQIYIEEYQEAMLKRLAEKRGQAEAMLIREALDGFMASAPLSDAQDRASWLRERDFILARQRKKPLKGSRKWTRDEIHDRRAKSG